MPSGAPWAGDKRGWEGENISSRTHRVPLSSSSTSSRIHRWHKHIISMCHGSGVVQYITVGGGFRRCMGCRCTTDPEVGVSLAEDPRDDDITPPHGQHAIGRVMVDVSIYYFSTSCTVSCMIPEDIIVALLISTSSFPLQYIDFGQDILRNLAARCLPLSRSLGHLAYSSGPSIIIAPTWWPRVSDPSSSSSLPSLCFHWRL